MGQLVLSGSLSVGPATSSPNVVPSASAVVQLFFANGSKASNVTTGSTSKVLNSPSAFVALGGIGTNEDVTTADFLYLNATAPILVELTTQDSAVNVVACAGPTMLNVNPANMIVGVRLKGSATIEYFASGPQ